MLDTFALELVAHGPGDANRAISSLMRAVPPGSTLECAHFELKREFSATAREWAELSKDVVALANCGGGVILFGVDDNGSRVGLAKSVRQ